MNSNIDSYEYFGISSNPNIAELKELYKGMAKKCHPDAGGTQDEFIELNPRTLTVVLPPGRPELLFT